MTQGQIKAIAEEVAHLRAFDGGFFPHEKEIREDYEVLLEWLNEKYCIVEREKVNDWWDDIVNSYSVNAYISFDGLKEMFTDFSAPRCSTQTKNEYD